MYINGEFVESHRGAVFPVYDPSTEEIIAEVPEADEKDVDRAVAAAKTAFESGAVAANHSPGPRPHPLSLGGTNSQAKRPIWLNWKRAIPASPSSKPNTTWPTPQPASNITAAWPPKYSAT